MRVKRYIFPILAALFMALPLRAEKATITAKLDSVHLIMGNTTTLHIQVVKERSVPGYFPMYTDNSGRSYIGLLNDTIELSRQFTSDTIDMGVGRVRINYNIPLQAFDSGFYRIPAIEYVAGVDTVRTEPIALKVLPVAAKASDKLAEFTDVDNGPALKWHDKIPNWLVTYWWLILLIILVIIAGVGTWFYYQRNGRLLPKKKPALPPYEAALQALEQLKDKKLWQNGMQDEYFVELTAILRTYLDKRFHVSAPEMTTEQFLQAAASDGRLTAYEAELRRLLELADFVKFARGQSLPQENNEAFDIVHDFVMHTKPTPEEIAAEAAKTAEAASAGKSAKVTSADKKGKKVKQPARNISKKEGGKK